MLKTRKSITLSLILVLAFSACSTKQPVPTPVSPTPSEVVTPRAPTETRTPVSATSSPTTTGEPAFEIDHYERLAFSAHVPLQSGIYTFSPFSEEPKRITELIHGQAYYSSPSWSPDGEQIAFTLEGAYGPEIYIVNKDGSDMHLLTEDLPEQSDPAWSPEGDKIAFVYRTSLYVIKPDGSDLQRLMGGIRPLFPVWSPDGSRIAFLSYNGEGGYDYQIHIINKDGSNLQTPTSRIGIYSHISWSPDSNKIVFGVREPCWDLASMDLSTGEIVQLTDTPGWERDPAWSPDGRYIVFASAPASECQPLQYLGAVNGGFDLYIMDKDGGQIDRLTFFSQGASQPVWWPVTMLQIGHKYKVVRDLEVYENASTSSNLLAPLGKGEIFTPLEGPLEANNLRWWRVRMKDGLAGWITESPGDYLNVDPPN
jgi:Tol biopolymer transport system component